MRLILDTNLLFSSIVKPDGRIADIIMNQGFKLEKIGCYFSHIELFSHKQKLLNISKLSEVELLDVMYLILKQINFVNEVNIPTQFHMQAFQLTKDIDEKDTIFVAMSLFLDCNIWSGDKVLIEGLRRKGFTNIISTNELIEMLNISNI